MCTLYSVNGWGYEQRPGVPVVTGSPPFLFVGESGGSWFDGANWMGGWVPEDWMEVAVPDGVTVVVGSGEAEAASVALGEGSRLVLSEAGSSLDVGSISADGAVVQIDAGVLRSAAPIEIGCGGLGLLIADGVIEAPEVRLCELGTLVGAGTVDGDLVNGGLVAPGSLPGVLTVLGDYAQEPAGTLEIEIAGPIPGHGHDVLSVAGTAGLSGTLAVELLGGFVPSAGDQFEVVSASGGVSGMFDRVVSEAEAECVLHEVDYGPQAVSVSVETGPFDPHWNNAAGIPGPDDVVIAMAVFDDGTGEALYVGGNFTSIGGVEANYIARWDGESWSALGEGVDSFVEALVVHDDGTGPALYVGGWFTTAGGEPANRIARWDGAAWSAVGEGMSSAVQGLGVFDDGTGERLYAGGLFRFADGEPAERIARWDGTAWEPVGAGMDDTVRHFAVFDDGTGDALYAAGAFATVFGVPGTSRLARWDGESWSSVGGGFDHHLIEIATIDLGGGPALYAVGIFGSAGGVSASRVAKWDGASWSALGEGLNDRARGVFGFDDGSGPAVYVTGDFTIAGGDVEARHIARWDGTSWSAVGLGLDDWAKPMMVFRDGAGPALYVGGSFGEAGGLVTERVAAWASCSLGREEPCLPDFAPPFGVLDIFDVLVFLGLFSTGSPAADLAPPFGVLDIFDVIEFLALFEQGCP